MKTFITHFVTGFLTILAARAQPSSDSMPLVQAMEVINYYIGRSFHKEFSKAKIHNPIEAGKSHVFVDFRN